MVNKATRGKVLKFACMQNDVHVRLTMRAAVCGDRVVNNVSLDRFISIVFNNHFKINIDKRRTFSLMTSN